MKIKIVMKSKFGFIYTVKYSLWIENRNKKIQKKYRKPESAKKIQSVFFSTNILMPC